MAVLLPLAALATVEGAPSTRSLRASAAAPQVGEEPSFATCNRKSRSGCACLDECATARWGGFVCSVSAGAHCPKAAFPHYDWCCPDKKKSCCVDAAGKPHDYFAHGHLIGGHTTVHQQVAELAAKKKGLYMGTVDQYDTAITAAEDWAMQAARQAATVEVLKADGDYKHAISAQAEEVAAMAAYDKGVRKAARDEVAWLRAEVAHGRATNSTVRHKIFGARAAIEETVMKRVAVKLQKDVDKAKAAAAALQKADHAHGGHGAQSAKMLDMDKRVEALAMLVKMEKENAMEAGGLKKAAYSALNVIDGWDWPHQQAAYATVDLALEAEARTRKAAHESHELLLQLIAQHQKEKLRAAKTGLWSTTAFREQERQSARAAADGNELEERAASDVEKFEKVVLAHNKKVALAYEVVAEAAAPAEAAKAARRAAVALKAERASQKMSKQVGPPLPSPPPPAPAPLACPLTVLTDALFLPAAVPAAAAAAAPAATRPAVSLARSRARASPTSCAPSTTSRWRTPWPRRSTTTLRRPPKSRRSRRRPRRCGSAARCSCAPWWHCPASHACCSATWRGSATACPAWRWAVSSTRR